MEMCWRTVQREHLVIPCSYQRLHARCMINSDIHDFLWPYWHSQYCIPEYENVEDEVLLDEEPDQDEADAAATSRQAGDDSPPAVTSKYLFLMPAP